MHQAVIDGADWAPNTEQRNDIIKILRFAMDFTKKIVVNITNLRIKVAKLKDLGIPVDYPLLAVIVLAELIIPTITAATPTSTITTDSTRTISRILSGLLVEYDCSKSKFRHVEIQTKFS
jgi:hypothetical protein